jgi:hypothetical protein
MVPYGKTPSSRKFGMPEQRRPGYFYRGNISDYTIFSDFIAQIHCIYCLGRDSTGVGETTVGTRPEMRGYLHYAT